MTLSMFHSSETLVHRSSHVIGLAALALVVGLGGCSSDDGSGNKKAKQGESCQASNDCQKPLRCRQGTCKAPPDTMGADAMPTDAESDGHSQDDGGGPALEPENYSMSYIVEDLFENTRELRVYSTEDQEETVVSPSSDACQQSCWITRDLSTFVYTVEGLSTGNRNIKAAEVNENLKARGEGDVIVEGVQNVRVRGNHLVYARSRQDNEGNRQRVIYYREATTDGSASETEVGATGVQGQTDWFVDPDRDVAVEYDQTQSGKIRLRVGSIDNWANNKKIVIDGTNYKTPPTGLFGGIRSTAVSRDGNILAFSVTKGPNSYNRCERQNRGEPYSIKNQGCGASEYGFRCGDQQRGTRRCTRLESTIYFVDLREEFRQKLGSNCGSGGDGCGPYQKCYTPGNNIDQAQCVPGRTTVGVSPQEGLQSSDCELAKSDPLIDFTGITGPLSFDEQGRLYAVGVRDRSCLQGDFGDNDRTSQIIRIDPEKRSSYDLTRRESQERQYEIIEGLPADQRFEPSSCQGETGFELESCQVFVGEVRISPNGQEIAYTATNPNSARPLAREKLYLWHALRDGSQRRVAGDEETVRANDNKEYRQLRVHTGPSN